MELNRGNKEQHFARYWDREFAKLYQGLGLMSGERCLPLHEVCELRDKCWRGHENSYPNDLETAQIARPWVGEYYPQTRLLGIGINLNVGGGFQQLCDETEQARKEMEQGKGRVFIQPGYGGSYFHPCLGSYAAKLLSKKGAFVSASEAFRYLSYTQHVKCSPKDEKRRGRPYREMWKACGEHILWEEMRLLKPKLVLIFGKTQNWEYTCRLFGGDCSGGEFRHVVWGVSKEGPLLVGVRHPMTVGGSRKEEVLGELGRVPWDI